MSIIRLIKGDTRSSDYSSHASSICCAKFEVSDDIAIVGTLDFFTPIVDEPEARGFA